MFRYLTRGFGVGCLLVMAAGGGAVPGADPAVDIETQYQTVLRVLQKPGVAGVLVTEVGPESAAAAGALRGGDIITEYDGTRVTTLKSLTEQVAGAVGLRLFEKTKGDRVQERVLIRVRRGMEDLLLQVPREALGIRGVEVEANVPGPRNPPPNLRGTLALDWKGVTAGLEGERNTTAFLRSFERIESDVPANMATEDWIGWQTCEVAIGGQSMSGKVDWYRIDESAPAAKAGSVPLTDRATVTFQLSIGDYKTSPAFVLSEATARYTGDANTQVTATAKRVGEKIQATITVDAGGNGNGAGGHENVTPLNAIPQAALPWVAAAMPHEVDATLGVYLISLRDFLARPGYAISTRGKQSIVGDPAISGWRVDLTHFGVVVESYWFSDERRLLCIASQGARAIVSRRVLDLKQASMPLEQKAAAAPAGPQ